MPSAARSHAIHWLLNDGLKQVELRLGPIVYPLTQAILIAGDDRNCRHASGGAARLLGLARNQIVGRKMDHLAEPGFHPRIDGLWQRFLQSGEQHGSFPFLSVDGTVRELGYTAMGNVLPGRHVAALHSPSTHVDPAREKRALDYAVYLFDGGGRILSWYAGSERLYGYPAADIVGESVTALCTDDNAPVELDGELERAAAQGHVGLECWHSRKDGARFWANSLTIALRSESGQLEGFARIVRDFSKSHSEEKLRPVGVFARSGRPEEASIAGVVGGEFDNITETNSAFLQMTGYSREDLAEGRLYLPDLTPPEYWHLDEAAHEEALRYGACSPFEKEYVRKDGTRIRVLVTLAVLNLDPFHWMAVVYLLTRAGEEIPAEPVGGNFDEIVGRSAGMRRVLRLVETVGPTDATVLILGETGTGKELIARAIHRLSHRQKFPFVTLNCAAIPHGLLESELFGYERGAFTGALTQKIGRFELADHGTLFLDEVGDIPLELQPKLLRALQDKAFERLGGVRTIAIDVRLVAATNRDLTQMMTDKLFRSDLFYRLKVFPITTPPLRDHPDDIPDLARYFMSKYALEMAKQVERIPSETMRALMSWSWPGNVRELENFIERSVILSTDSTLRAPLGELKAEIDEVITTGTLAEMERAYILQVLREASGVISAAAARLGLPRTTLNAMMRKLEISRKDL